MINVEIRDSEWRNFGEIEVEPGVPYWFKKINGNVVLAVHLTTKIADGWAAVSLDEAGNLVILQNTWHMLRGAKMQCALVK